MIYKKCTECQLTYEETEDNFRLYKYNYKTEYCDICLNCEKEKQREYSRERYKVIKQAEYDLSAKDWEDCLQYFNYKDAYTGMPLINASMDHIIPITQFGGTIRENIIPCNAEINSSKNNRHMIEWYKKQCFFSDERLRKILTWMGDYKKYLYIPIEQREFIDINESKSIYHFTITLPNGYKKKLYYSANGNPKKRTILLKKVILDDWEDYFNKRWLFDGKTDAHRMNPEDKTKNVLDRCGSFLLIKDKGKKHKILNKKDIDNIYTSEIPLSCVASNIQDAVYGLNIDDEDYTFSSENFNFIKYDKANKKIKIKNREESKTYKQNNIYKGLIDKSKPYIAEWCIVDTENIFEFKGNKYKISEDVLQYNIRIKKPRYDDYKSDYQMDQILVYEQDGNLFFFDQNIEQIENEKIIKL